MTLVKSECPLAAQSAIKTAAISSLICENIKISVTRQKKIKELCQETVNYPTPGEQIYPCERRIYTDLIIDVEDGKHTRKLIQTLWSDNTAITFPPQKTALDTSPVLQSAFKFNILHLVVVLLQRTEATITSIIITNAITTTATTTTTMFYYY